MIYQARSGCNESRLTSINQHISSFMEEITPKNGKWTDRQRETELDKGTKSNYSSQTYRSSSISIAILKNDVAFSVKFTHAV